VGSLADEALWADVDLRADAQRVDFTVARFAGAERFAVEAASAVAEGAVSTVVVDTVVVADMAADTGKFVRGLS
jgi:hypothetical protein